MVNPNQESLVYPTNALLIGNQNQDDFGKINRIRFMSKVHSSRQWKFDGRRAGPSGILYVSKVFLLRYSAIGNDRYNDDDCTTYAPDTTQFLFYYSFNAFIAYGERYENAFFDCLLLWWETKMAVNSKTFACGDDLLSERKRKPSNDYCTTDVCCSQHTLLSHLLDN